MQHQKNMKQAAQHSNLRRSAPRTAFTMIELVIVILIIGILLAFLLPAVSGAITKARYATLTAEMKNLEQAIQKFKLQFGVEPPSHIFLYEQAAGWDNNTDLVTRRSMAFIRQVWPNFDFDYTSTSGELDINGNDAIETANDGRIELRGAECLVFFLGGVCATEDSTGASLRDASGSTAPSGTAGTIAKWFPLGFSTNPETPFVRGGTRVGPFYEFDSARLTDVSSSLLRSMPEYLDSLPGQVAPYIYVNSNEGRGYAILDSDSDGNPNGFADLDLNSSSITSPTFIYLQSGTVSGGEVAAGYVPYNANSFQIISAGLDQQYGVGGVYSSDDGFEAMESAYSTYELGVQHDNATNFAGGRLVP